MSFYRHIPEPPIVPPEYDVPHCPVCDAETDTLYRNNDGDIVGCSECLHLVDAYEWEEENRDY